MNNYVDFAEPMGIHAAIVVGRLQHDHFIDRFWMNGFKKNLHFQEEISIFLYNKNLGL